jgi:dynein heavy chain
LLSVFDNTRTVTFDEKVYDKILALNSQEGENVPLEEAVMAQVCSISLHTESSEHSN